VELVDVTRRKLEFSYKDQDGYVFMDPETYETETLFPDLLENLHEYLTENLAVDVLYAEGKPVEVDLPSSVVLTVVEAAEGLRGDSATNVQKPVKLETGKTIQAPLFIKEGEAIRVDTRTGAYLGRA
jgi:elongation factor P